MGYVYFISQGNKVKIGYSKNPKKRLKTLSTSSPLSLVLLGYFEGTFNDEKKMHIKFHKYHLQLEWFELNQAIVDFINLVNVMDVYCGFDDKGIVRVYKKMKK